MGFALIRCPHCGGVMEFGQGGAMNSKYGLTIGSHKTLMCFKCGGEVLVQGEWDSFAWDMKIGYVIKRFMMCFIGLCIGTMGIAFMFNARIIGDMAGVRFEGVKYQWETLFSVGMIAIGIWLVGWGILDLWKITESKGRTRYLQY